MGSIFFLFDLANLSTLQNAELISVCRSGLVKERTQLFPNV